MTTQMDEIKAASRAAHAAGRRFAFTVTPGAVDLCELCGKGGKPMFRLYLTMTGCRHARCPKA